jgi:hypothetical protein
LWNGNLQHIAIFLKGFALCFAHFPNLSTLAKHHAKLGSSKSFKEASVDTPHLY